MSVNHVSICQSHDWFKDILQNVSWYCLELDPLKIYISLSNSGIAALRLIIGYSA